MPQRGVQIGISAQHHAGAPPADPTHDIVVAAEQGVDLATDDQADVQAPGRGRGTVQLCSELVAVGPVESERDLVHDQQS